MEKPVIEKGQIWMLRTGDIVQISVLHGGHSDYPFQVRISGSVHNYTCGYEDLLYKIGG